MSLVALWRGEPDDATLIRRARRGDQRARRIYVRRHALRAVQLAELLVTGPDETAGFATAVLDDTIAAGIPGDDALVQCAVRRAAATADDEARTRLVTVLTAVEGRSEEDVATLLALPVAEVAALRAAGDDDGDVRSRGDCRGWPLASRRDRLTRHEQQAANAHLTLCRPCRVRLDTQRRTRDRLRLSGAAATAVVAADVVSLAAPAGGAVAGFGGFAAIVGGKAGAAVVGAAALAIGVTSTGIAVARQAPGRPPAPVHQPAAPQGGDSDATPATGGVASPGTVGSTPGDAGSTAGSPLPTSRTAPLPTSTSVATTTPAGLLPTATSIVPLPTVSSLLPLPTLSPTPLPTSPPPLPLPTSILPTATSLLNP